MTLINLGIDGMQAQGDGSIMIKSNGTRPVNLIQMHRVKANHQNPGLNRRAHLPGQRSAHPIRGRQNMTSHLDHIEEQEL
eukprot:443586-Karenia_brevis.AAC.1